MTPGATPAAPVRPQRLALVVPSPGTHDSRTMRIAASLAARGHEVVVHARSGPGVPAGDEHVDGYRIVRASVSPAAGLPLPFRIVDRALTTRRQGRAASVADAGADLYHGMAFMGIPVALRLAAISAAPVVYDARDLYADARSLARLPSPLRAVIRAREKSWAHRASRVITVNDGLADVLAERLKIERPAVVMNCPPRWTPGPDRPRRFHEALGLPARARVVLYHGGLEPGRGIEQLLAAAPSFPDDVRVVLLGYGSLREALALQVRRDTRLDDRVHLLDAVSPGELPGWVASADVAVVAIQPTTLNHRLSTPNKLFEALAVGVPVVASDFPAMRRIVIEDPDGPLGAVCDPTDAGHVGDAIVGLLALDETAMLGLRARCLTAAHARYAWEAQLDVLLGVYGSLTGRPW